MIDNDSYSDVCLRLAECHHYGIGTKADLIAARYYICIAKEEIKKRLDQGDMYGGGSMGRAEDEWQKLFGGSEDHDCHAGLTQNRAMRLKFLEFIDYEEGKMAAISMIPMGTFPADDNWEEFKASPHILFTGKVLDFEWDTYAEPWIIGLTSPRKCPHPQFAQKSACQRCKVMVSSYMSLESGGKKVLV